MPICCLSLSLDLQHGSIKLIAYLTIAVAIWNIAYCIYLLNFAIATRQDVGDYLDMVSENDGTIIPILAVFPAVLCIATSAASFYLLYRAFSVNTKPNINNLMYSFVLLLLGTILITLIICLMLLTRIYSSSKTLHDGIMEAMNNYRSDSLIKSRIDSLQIQFQCCGSVQYKEWYEITWYDTNLVDKKDENEYRYQAPFSCCSMKSIYPCIHHNIESSGLPYKYTKEQNFSLSTAGCFKVVVQLKKQIGLAVIGRLAALVFTQLLMTTTVRLLQTAHSLTNVLFCPNAIYTSWLFGYYRKRKPGEPPPVPPIPKELMDNGE
ncbi:hypothetical protein ILUMI_04866 [Ignelater luminosus]|uniref:Tetraspanin n=1 Tax=Ignelater luminosus TaxID=2038154 RepID=A0A8K0DDN1_IGNLU|nr:hypothetical protein ILUMI_04866 [Ignelater luminosus]